MQDLVQKEQARLERALSSTNKAGGRSAKFVMGSSRNNQLLNSLTSTSTFISGTSNSPSTPCKPSSSNSTSKLVNSSNCNSSIQTKATSPNSILPTSVNPPPSLLPSSSGNNLNFSNECQETTKEEATNALLSSVPNHRRQQVFGQQFPSGYLVDQSFHEIGKDRENVVVVQQLQVQLKQSQGELEKLREDFLLLQKSLEDSERLRKQETEELQNQLKTISSLNSKLQEKKKSLRSERDFLHQRLMDKDQMLVRLMNDRLETETLLRQVAARDLERNGKKEKKKGGGSSPLILSSSPSSSVEETNRVGTPNGERRARVQRSETITEGMSTNPKSIMSRVTTTNDGVSPQPSPSSPQLSHQILHSPSLDWTVTRPSSVINSQSQVSRIPPSLKSLGHQQSLPSIHSTSGSILSSSSSSPSPSRHVTFNTTPVTPPSHRNLPQWSGWLWKVGGKRNKLKRWQKRWFVLRGPTIRYFKWETEGESRGTVSVNLITKITPNADHITNRKFSFTLATASRVYFISARSVEEREKWVSMINLATEARHAYRSRIYSQGLAKISPPHSPSSISQVLDSTLSPTSPMSSPSSSSVATLPIEGDEEDAEDFVEVEVEEEEEDSDPDSEPFQPPSYAPPEPPVILPPPFPPPAPPSSLTNYSPLIEEHPLKSSESTKKKKKRKKTKVETSSLLEETETRDRKREEETKEEVQLREEQVEVEGEEEKENQEEDSRGNLLQQLEEGLSEGIQGLGFDVTTLGRYSLSLDGLKIPLPDEEEGQGQEVQEKVEVAPGQDLVLSSSLQVPDVPPELAQEQETVEDGSE